MADPQLGLFAGSTKPIEKVATYDDPEARALASKLPSWIRFGTSSWTFQGWNGIVYAGDPSHDALVARGLEAYAAYPLFRCAGIDRSYYAPLDANDLATYAAQLPASFPAIAKVWSEITTYAFADHPSHGPRAGELNPHFLDADLTKELLAPYTDSFASHAGPFIFEVPPIARGRGPSDETFCDAIGRFLRLLPSHSSYAFELRNRELVTPRYLATLRDHGAAHVLNLWTAMPSLAEQLATRDILTSDFVVARLLLAPGSTYAAKKEAFAPFNRIVEPREDVRDDVVKLVRLCEAAKMRDLFVLVGNKVEGSAPLTVRALASRIVRDYAR